MSTSSTNAAAESPYVVEDCRGALQVLSDGTVVRSPPPPTSEADDNDGGRVEWKDGVDDDGHGLGLRMYRPRGHGAAGGKTLLPVLVYFHGGGFCIGSYSWPKN